MLRVKVSAYSFERDTIQSIAELFSFTELNSASLCVAVMLPGGTEMI
jgi:hypothetical protein